jgi:hypothetical protein
MRSIFALASAAWFVGAAILLGDGSIGTRGDPPNEEILGDPIVMAIHLAARLAFVGLALVALALVDWARMGDAIGRSTDAGPSEPGA